MRRKVKAKRQNTPPPDGRPEGAKNKPRQPSPDSPWMSRKEFCTQHGISSATFHRRHARHLKIAKFGRFDLIERESARKYVEGLVRSPQQAA